MTDQVQGHSIEGGNPLMVLLLWVIPWSNCKGDTLFLLFLLVFSDPPSDAQNHDLLRAESRTQLMTWVLIILRWQHRHQERHQSPPGDLPYLLMIWNTLCFNVKFNRFETISRSLPRVVEVGERLQVPCVCVRLLTHESFLSSSPVGKLQPDRPLRCNCTILQHLLKRENHLS